MIVIITWIILFMLMMVIVIISERMSRYVRVYLQFTFAITGECGWSCSHCWRWWVLLLAWVSPLLTWVSPLVDWSVPLQMPLVFLIVYWPKLDKGNERSGPGSVLCLSLFCLYDIFLGVDCHRVDLKWVRQECTLHSIGCYNWGSIAGVL